MYWDVIIFIGVGLCCDVYIYMNSSFKVVYLLEYNLQ